MVRLRKKNFKNDRCRIAFGEAKTRSRMIVRDQGHLSETRNRFRIDVNDTDRQIWIVGSRRQSLIGVESNQP